MLAGKQENLFKQWLEEHKGVILKVVRAYAADTEDQDDLFQEITTNIQISYYFLVC